MHRNGELFLHLRPRWLRRDDTSAGAADSGAGGDTGRRGVGGGPGAGPRDPYGLPEVRDGAPVRPHFAVPLCSGSGLNFYPTRLVRGRGGNFGQLVEQADESEENVAPLRALCVRCEHAQECLLHALAADEVGVWGSTTTAERKKLRGLLLRGYVVGSRCATCGGVYTWKRRGERWHCGHCGFEWGRGS